MVAQSSEPWQISQAILLIGEDKYFVHSSGVISVSEFSSKRVEYVRLMFENTDSK